MSHNATTTSELTERLRLAQNAYNQAELAHRSYPTRRSLEMVRRTLETLGKAREEE